MNSESCIFVVGVLSTLAVSAGCQPPPSHVRALDNAPKAAPPPLPTQAPTPIPDPVPPPKAELPPEEPGQGPNPLRCRRGEGCAAAGPYVEGTCCAVGDSLLHVGFGNGSEVVDLEADDHHVVLCGGFGARISSAASPGDAEFIGSASPRCQRIAFGPTLDGGAQILYLAHHGDSWVRTPFLKTFRIEPDGGVREVHAIEDVGILFEGLAWNEALVHGSV